MTTKFVAELTPSRAYLLAEMLREAAGDPHFDGTVNAVELDHVADLIENVGHERAHELEAAAPGWHRCHAWLGGAA